MLFYTMNFWFRLSAVLFSLASYAWVGSTCKLPPFENNAPKCTVSETGDDCCSGFNCVNGECMPSVSPGDIGPEDFALVAQAVVLQARNFSFNLLQSIDWAAAEIARANEKLGKQRAEAKEESDETRNDTTSKSTGITGDAREKLQRTQEKLGEGVAAAKGSLKANSEKLREMMKNALKSNDKNETPAGTVQITSLNSVENKQHKQSSKQGSVLSEYIPPTVVGSKKSDDKKDHHSHKKEEADLDNMALSEFTPQAMRGSGKPDNNKDSQIHDWQKFVPGNSEGGDSVEEPSKLENTVNEQTSEELTGGPEEDDQGKRTTEVDSVDALSKYIPGGMGKSSETGPRSHENRESSRSHEDRNDLTKGESIPRYFDAVNFAYHTVRLDNAEEKSPDVIAAEANLMAILAAEAAETLAEKYLTAAAHLRQSAESLRKKVSSEPPSTEAEQLPYTHNVVALQGISGISAHKKIVIYTVIAAVAFVILGFAHARYSRRRHNYQRI